MGERDLTRQELSEPVGLVADAVHVLIERRDLTEARSLLDKIDEDALWEERNRALTAVKGIPGRTTLPAHAIPRPAALQVHQRNLFTCRYDRCGYTPTLDEDVLKLLGGLGVLDCYQPDRQPRWHPLSWTYMAAPEHVVPRSPKPEDWTTACWTCNSAKSDRLLEDLGWHYDPDPPQARWWGLRDRLGDLRRLAVELGSDPDPPTGRPSRRAKALAPQAERTTPVGQSPHRNQLAPATRGRRLTVEQMVDLRAPWWEDISYERSSADAATKAADLDRLPDDDPRRVGKPSGTYGNRRGYSVPPVKRPAPQIFATPDQRWRMFDTRKHPEAGRRNSALPWLLQRRE